MNHAQRAELRKLMAELAEDGQYLDNLSAGFDLRKAERAKMRAYVNTRKLIETMPALLDRLDRAEELLRACRNEFAGSAKDVTKDLRVTDLDRFLAVQD